MGRPKKKDMEPTGALATNTMSDGRRKIKLRAADRAQLVRRQKAEAACALFLDVERGLTWKEVALELGISIGALKDLTKTPEFDEAYNNLFPELGHDPRYQAARGVVGDMLPLAVKELKNILTDGRTPAGVRLKAIERILTLNGLQEPQNQGSDRQELARFLVEHRIKLETVGVVVPAEYQKALELATGGPIDEVVEGEIRDA
jgi:hypothetical protein